MATEYLNGHQAINTEENIRKTRETGKVKWNGQMGQNTMVSGQEESNTDSEECLLVMALSKKATLITICL